MPANTPGRFHNRLTHSLAVAGIGRRMALALLAHAGNARAAEDAGGLDPDVVDAACLAHDLGHPPFGHDGEGALDGALVAAGVADGFQANAQAFRVVTHLAGAGDAAGLNLTRATLAAILKYPWQRGESPDLPSKWGAYASEAAPLAWARASQPPGSRQPTLEAAVMDWADLIAYAVHDFEDFARARLIPLRRLQADRAERDYLLALVARRRGIPASEQVDLARVFDRFLAACRPAGSGKRQPLTDFTSRRIDAFVTSFALSGIRGEAHLAIDRECALEIFLLEGLTWHYVIDGGILSAQRREQRALIRALFDALAEAALDETGHDPFSALDRERLRQADDAPARLRIVADAIASMDERQAREAFAALGMEQRGPLANE